MEFAHQEQHRSESRSRLIGVNCCSYRDLTWIKETFSAFRLWSLFLFFFTNIMLIFSYCCHFLFLILSFLSLFFLILYWVTFILSLLFFSPSLFHVFSFLYLTFSLSLSFSLSSDMHFSHFHHNTDITL